MPNLWGSILWCQTIGRQSYGVPNLWGQSYGVPDLWGVNLMGGTRSYGRQVLWGTNWTTIPGVPNLVRPIIWAKTYGAPNYEAHNLMRVNYRVNLMGCQTYGVPILWGAKLMSSKLVVPNLWGANLMKCTWASILWSARLMGRQSYGVPNFGRRQSYECQTYGASIYARVPELTGPQSYGSANLWAPIYGRRQSLGAKLWASIIRVPARLMGHQSYGAELCWAGPIMEAVDLWASILWGTKL
ncbi:hypothetical protein AVEN_67246-1 [Araneus ventricosus]|uniref:Uncharacterized protein n=1 Tax=Araneus ventricosus TaxID=182803 RepID=A0A4Y2PW51_ARAVE|nr:hypothetical protein AVEN_67246-1 [Araneus ventricosus]